MALLFLEFATLIFGVSLLFNKVNAFQIVLHFIGCLATIWQILNLNQYKTMWTLMGFFGALPFSMEVFVIILAFTRYHVIDQVEQIQRNMEADARTRYQERLKMEQDRFKLKTPAEPAKPLK